MNIKNEIYQLRKRISDKTLLEIQDIIEKEIDIHRQLILKGIKLIK